MAVDKAEDRATVLLVESHEAARRLVVDSIDGHAPAPRFLHASSVTEAIARMDGREPDLVIAGPGLDPADSLELVERCHRIDPGLAVILLAGEDDEESARRAFRHGAEDYLPLRGSVLARLPHLVRRALERRRASAGREEAGVELLRSLSHELRSPLAGLAALVEMLSAGADGALNTAQSARVRRIRASVDRLCAVADQISDLARLSSGRLPLTLAPVDFASVLLEAEDALIAEALTRGVDLRVIVADRLPKVMGDAARLGQALRHMISAVLRHTASGTLEISAGSGDSRIEVIIREQASGIPVEAATPQLLAEAEAGQHLGLSIAARLLRMHGGSLRQGGDGEGSALLCFSLPVARHEPPARQEAADPIRPSP